MIKSFCRFALPVAATLAWFTGCRPAQKDTGHALPEPPRVASCEPGKRGGRLTLALLGNPRTFNPLFAGDSASEDVVRMMFGPLVVVNMATQEPEPGLAESWSVDADQKTWTFKLRKNLRWSDGTPLTADDVVFTWNGVMYNPAYNHFTYELFRIDGKQFEVTKVDDLTVRVVTSEVFAPFVEYFGGMLVLPRHMLARAVQQGRFADSYAVSTPPERVVGCGPYRLKEFRSGEFALLERNPEFWMTDKSGQRLPYFDEIMLTVTRNPSAAAAELFLKGKAAAYENISREEWPAFKQAAAKGDRRIVEFGPGAQRDFLWFNQNTGSGADGKPLVDPMKLKWFREKKFRQAMSCAINRDQIVREVYGGRAQKVNGFFSSENKKWNNPDIASYDYDPARARALLAESGMQNAGGVLRDAGGNAVEFTLCSNFDNPARGKAATFIQEALKAIGIRVNYQPVTFPALLQRVNQTLDYECALMGLGGGGNDPASQVNVLKSSEGLHQWFPRQKTPSTEWEARIDALMDSQMRTLDPVQRKKDFDEVQAIWAEELPMICIAAPFTSAAIRSDLGNVRPSLASTHHLTWNIEELFLKSR